jgi:peptide deformylase
MRNLIKAPSPFLTRPCTAIDFTASYTTTEYLNNIVTDMINAMHNNGGCGLAAPQIGICKQIIIVENPETKNLITVINPVINVLDATPQTMPEGCLSYPNKQRIIDRPSMIEVVGFNIDGTQFKYIAKDFEARIFCHEVDHLKGKCLLGA